MIPLNDNLKIKRFPLITWILILINCAVFLYEINLENEQLQYFVDRFSVIPGLSGWLDENSYRLVTNLFLHGSWWHLIGNMWFLYLFGRAVEDRMGHISFLSFYLLIGVLANFTHLAFAGSSVPVIGASGAISGVMAAYLVLFSDSLILSLVPVFIFPLFVPIRAFWYIGFWFVIQIFQGTASALGVGTQQIAFAAHIGGFIAGLLIYRLFIKSQAQSEFYQWHFPDSMEKDWQYS